MTDKQWAEWRRDMDKLTWSHPTMQWLAGCKFSKEANDA